MLSIAEEILFLSLNEEKKEFYKESEYGLNFALFSSILFELALESVINFKGNKIHLNENLASENEINKKIVNYMIKSGKKEISLDKLLKNLENEFADIKEILITEMSAKNYLSHSTKKVRFGLAKKNVVELSKVDLKNEILQKFSRIINQQEQASLQDVFILGVIKNLDLLEPVFKKEKYLAENRINLKINEKINSHDYDKSIINLMTSILTEISVKYTVMDIKH